jgi:hypothetical protein
LPIALSLLLILLTILACGGAGIPSTSPDTIDTIVAATMAAVTPAPSATPVPPTATLVPLVLPTIAPTTQLVGAPTIIVLPAASRITFLTGATMGAVSGPVQPGQSINYVLQAAQGQPMMVDVSSLNNDVTLSMKTQGGTSMLNASAQESRWQGSLPQTEDYYLTVHGGATTENFTMTITIPSRIRFAEGADSAKVSGKTVAGYNVAYTLFAVKDQRMSVELSSVSGNAVLSIYGWNDGQPYVRSAAEKTSFSFTLPATQDYIVQIVPRAGSTESYLLKVEIK